MIRMYCGPSDPCCLQELLVNLTARSRARASRAAIPRQSARSTCLRRAGTIRPGQRDGASRRSRCLTGIPALRLMHWSTRPRSGIVRDKHGYPSPLQADRLRRSPSMSTLAGTIGEAANPRFWPQCARPCNGWLLARWRIPVQGIKAVSIAGFGRRCRHRFPAGCHW